MLHNLAPGHLSRLTHPAASNSTPGPLHTPFASRALPSGVCVATSHLFRPLLKFFSDLPGQHIHIATPTPAWTLPCPPSLLHWSFSCLSPFNILCVLHINLFTISLSHYNLSFRKAEICLFFVPCCIASTYNSLCHTAALSFPGITHLLSRPFSKRLAFPSIL